MNADPATAWQPPPQAPSYAYQPAVKPQVEAYCATAFVLSLCSFIVPIVTPIVALFMARAGRRNVKAADGFRRGNGLAIAAIVISLLSLISSVALLLVIWLVTR